MIWSIIGAEFRIDPEEKTGESGSWNDHMKLVRETHMDRVPNKKCDF